MSGTTQQTASLMGVSGEIRNTIFDLAIGDPAILDPFNMGKHGGEPALLRVSKQVRGETRACFYDDLKLEVTSTGDDLMHKLPAAYRQIKKFESLGLPAPTLVVEIYQDPADNDTTATVAEGEFRHYTDPVFNTALQYAWIPAQSEIDMFFRLRTAGLDLTALKIGGKVPYARGMLYVEIYNNEEITRLENAIQEALVATGADGNNIAPSTQPNEPTLSYSDVEGFRQMLNVGVPGVVYGTA